MSDRVGYAVYRVLSGIFGVFPEPVMRRLGEGVGWAASWIARKKYRQALAHQRRVLGDTPAAKRSARRVFRYYGRYWAETFWMRPRRRDSVLARSQLVNVERLVEAAQSGRGVVLALPHMGNWEAAGLSSASVGARVLAVAEELGNERIVEWFINMRAVMDIDIVIARKGSRVTRVLLDRLREGGAVALLCDRDLSGTGLAVTLFGEETTIPAGPAVLAERTGAVLLPVGIYHRPKGRHDFVIHPELEIPNAETSEERVKLVADRLAEIIEQIVREDPAQWHLLQPNWPSDRAA